MRRTLIPLLILAGAAFGASSGDLDPSFGGDGVVITQWPTWTWVNDVAVRPDGKVVAVGFYGNDGKPPRAFVSCHGADGVLDAGFGNGGLVVLVPDQGDIGTAVAVDAAGNAYVAVKHRVYVPGKGKSAGATVDRHLVVKLDPSGQPVPSFGAGGAVEFTAGKGSIAKAITLDEAYGRVYLAGDAYVGAKTSTDICVTALDMATGAPVAAFGGGTVYVAASTGYDECKAVAVDPLHRVVFAGRSGGSGIDYGSIVVGRLSAAGQLDATFGGKGYVLDTGLAAFDWVTIGGMTTGGLAIQPDARIVLAGRLYSAATDFESWLRRYETNGAVDASLGGSGLATTGYLGEDQGRDVVVDADGTLHLLSSYVTGPGDLDVDLAVWTFDAAGTLVRRSALVHEHPVGGAHIGNALAPADGALLIGGSMSPDSDGAHHHAMLARILK